VEPDLGRLDHRGDPPVSLLLLMQQHFIAGLTAGAESD
jgi:hypothetical protein